jgi:hypothetical protein
MFAWSLYFLLIVICLPGIALTIPRTLESLRGQIEANLKPGQTLPPFPLLIVISALQATVLIAIAAAIGVGTMAQTGLQAPFLASVASGQPEGSLLWPQLVAGTVGAIICMGPFLAAYYGYFRPRLDPATVRVTEAMRERLGLAGRLLYGGIYEELLFRWGLISLFVWLGTLLTGSVNSILVWVAIVLAGILFGAGHLPGTIAAGARKSTLLVMATLGLNGWAALIFGYLFWQYGLTAAILAHMLLHLSWYPLERRFQSGA